jgi:hypothetical protein
VRALVNGPTTLVPAFDQVLAEAAGVLCGRARTSDVVDASVVLVARRERAVVVAYDELLSSRARTSTTRGGRRAGLLAAAA